MNGYRPAIEREFVYRGYQCVVLFQPVCCRCGYVGIPKWHPSYNVDYNKLEIKCHGGPTYSSKQLASFDPKGEKHLWWIGFDCAHRGDEPDFQTGRKLYSDDPAILQKIEHFEEIFGSHSRYGTSKSLQYVETECMYIVDQLIKEEGS